MSGKSGKVEFCVDSGAEESVCPAARRGSFRLNAQRVGEGLEVLMGLRLNTTVRGRWSLSRFLEARPLPSVSEESADNLVEHSNNVSVSPLENTDENYEDTGEYLEDGEADTIGVDSKNITVEDEIEVIRKIRDPKLPRGLV